MGANNCKSAEALQPVFDDFFDKSYGLIALFTLSPFLPVVNYSLEIPIVILKILLWNRMFEIGGAVECAIDNNINGPNTISLFQDGSALYVFIALAYFAFDVFINPLIFVGIYIFELVYLFASWSLASSGLYVWWVPFINLLPLSASTLWWLPIVPYYWSIQIYTEVFRFLPLLAAMYFTNSVYFGFHPTVAPELQATRQSE